MGNLIGDLTSVPQPIEVKLFGDDPAQLADAAGRVVAAVGRIWRAGEGGRLLR